MAITRELAALKQGSAYLAYCSGDLRLWRLSMVRPGLAGLQEVGMARPRPRRLGLGQAGSSCGWRPAGSLHRVQLKAGETQHALRQAATRV